MGGGISDGGCDTGGILENKINGKSTVQTLNSCTSRPDVCQCLVVQIPMNNLPKK